jgi:hypothetical protein
MHTTPTSETARSFKLDGRSNLRQEALLWQLETGAIHPVTKQKGERLKWYTPRSRSNDEEETGRAVT